jgi:hypothetical protein
MKLKGKAQLYPHLHIVIPILPLARVPMGHGLMDNKGKRRNHVCFVMYKLFKYRSVRPL